MNKERYVPMVMPDKAGNTNWILQRVALGEAKRQELQEFISGRYKRLSKMGYYGEDTEALSDYLNSHWPFTSYQLNLAEIISPEKKRNIFIPSIAAMRKVIAGYGVEAPEEEDLLGRLLIVDGETFRNISLQEGNRENFIVSERIGGETFGHIGVCLINTENIRTVRYLREVGIHELWHSITYKEFWVPQEYRDKLEEMEEFQTRRGGIITKRPKIRKQADSIMAPLDEGLTDYQTKAALKLAGEDIPPTPYTAELKVANSLIKRIGLEVLMRAQLTKEGYRDFFKAMELRYGRHAISRFGLALAGDYSAYETAKPFKEGSRPDYTRTLRFVRKVLSKG